MTWVGQVSSSFSSESLPPFSAPGDSASCKQITSADEVRNMEWATATCVLGFGVFGKFWNGDGITEPRCLKKHPCLVAFTVFFYWLPPGQEAHSFTPMGSICVLGGRRGMGAVLDDCRGCLDLQCNETRWVVAPGPERIILPRPQPLLYSGINAVNNYFLSTSVGHGGDHRGPSLGIMVFIVRWGRLTCPWTAQSRLGRDKEAQWWCLACL